VKTAVELPEKQIADLCRHWRIARLEIFGSALREDFGPGSDMDFLFTPGPGFKREEAYGRWGHNRMAEELSALVGRPVDLIERSQIEGHRNWIRREHILRTAQPVYVEG
jgi:uncharacterized protein